MEKLKDLRDRICSFENVLAAYHEAVKGKRYRGEVIAFRYNLEENLLQIIDDLQSMTYTVGHYREFYVRHPKPRLVMALGFRDRVVQWAIYRQLNPYLEKRYITHSYGCRKGKGTLAAAKQALSWTQLISRKADAREWVIIKADISKYFYRTDHRLILERYAEYTDDEWFLWLMQTIICNPDVPFGLPPGVRADDCPRAQRLYDVGMPIGNLTSQETANLFLDELDQHIKHKLKVRYYIRYMDDFLLFVKGRDNARRTLESIAAFLHGMLLDVNPKTEIIQAQQTYEFVGYRVSPHGLRLRKQTIRHIKRNLKHQAKKYAEGRIPLRRVQDSIMSCHGMTKHCHGYHMRRWIYENVALVRHRRSETPCEPEASCSPPAEPTPSCPTQTEPLTYSSDRA